MEEEQSVNQPRISSSTAMAMIMLASFFSLLNLVAYLTGVGEIPFVTLAFIDTPNFVIFWIWCKRMTGYEPDNPRPVKYFKDFKSDWWKVVINIIPIVDLFSLVANIWAVIKRSRKEDEEYFASKQEAEEEEENVPATKGEVQKGTEQPAKPQVDGIRGPKESEDKAAQREKPKENIADTPETGATGETAPAPTSI